MKNEQKIRAELSRVLTNISNYPKNVQANLWGASLSDVVNKATEAVMATDLVEDETAKFVENLLADKRETMKGLIYMLIEAKRQNGNPFTAANIEIEKFRLQAEIDVLEYAVNG